MNDAHIVTAAGNYRLSDCFAAHRRRLTRNGSGPTAICASTMVGKKAKVASPSGSPSASPSASPAPAPRPAVQQEAPEAEGGSSPAAKGAGKHGKAAGSAAGSADVFPRRELEFPEEQAEGEAEAGAGNDGQDAGASGD